MTDRRIRVLALSPIPEEGAGCRFRVSQYIPYLREAGFDVTVSAFYTREYFDLVYQQGRYATKTMKFLALAMRRLAELTSLGSSNRSSPAAACRSSTTLTTRSSSPASVKPIALSPS
jgi:hypothetical protein